MSQVADCRRPSGAKLRTEDGVDGGAELPREAGKDADALLSGEVHSVAEPRSWRFRASVNFTGLSVVVEALVLVLDTVACT